MVAATQADSRHIWFGESIVSDKFVVRLLRVDFIPSKGLPIGTFHEVLKKVKDSFLIGFRKTFNEVMQIIFANDLGDDPPVFYTR